jgi:pilus assembly protein CpaB
MTRQTRTVVVLAVALVAAAASSVGIYTAVTRLPVKQVEVATVHAVVAAKAMPMGTRLTEESVKVVAWPARAPITDGFSDVKEVLDRGLIVSVAENEPLTAAKLAARGVGAGLPPTIPEGMRAMSVKVDEVVGVAGFVVPGTHVDVLTTIATESEAREKLTRVVVGNVQVLTAGTRYDQEDAKKEGKPIPSKVVTLLVTPDDAQKVALAQAEGEIMLALRNPLDVATPDLRPIGTSGLMGAPVRAAAPAPVVRKVEPKPVAVVVPPPPPPPKPYTVEAIRAAQRTEEVVR